MGFFNWLFTDPTIDQVAKSTLLLCEESKWICLLDDDTSPYDVQLLFAQFAEERGFVISSQSGQEPVCSLCKRKAYTTKLASPSRGLVWACDACLYGEMNAFQDDLLDDLASSATGSGNRHGRGDVDYDDDDDDGSYYYTEEGEEEEEDETDYSASGSGGSQDDDIALAARSTAHKWLFAHGFEDYWPAFRDEALLSVQDVLRADLDQAKLRLLGVRVGHMSRMTEALQALESAAATARAKRRAPAAPDAPGNGAPSAEGPDMVVALCSYEARTDDELSFHEGDVIRVVERGLDGGWWTGQLADAPDGPEALFSFDLVKPVPPKPSTKPPAAAASAPVAAADSARPRSRAPPRLCERCEHNVARSRVEMTDGTKHFLCGDCVQSMIEKERQQALAREAAARSHAAQQPDPSVTSATLVTAPPGTGDSLQLAAVASLSPVGASELDRLRANAVRFDRATGDLLAPLHVRTVSRRKRGGGRRRTLLRRDEAKALRNGAMRCWWYAVSCGDAPPRTLSFAFGFDLEGQRLLQVFYYDGNDDDYLSSEYFVHFFDEFAELLENHELLRLIE